MPEINDILKSCEVAISTKHDGYASEPPYSPGTCNPEYLFSSTTLSNEVNHAYEGVRDALRLLNLDVKHYGRGNWNPLGQFVRPGNTVVLKPNFIRDFREMQPDHEDCLITHGSVIRAALDYVYIALKGEGRIIIADAPQNDADFDEIRRMTGLDEIQEFYSRHVGFKVEIYDLRPEKARKVDGVIIGHEKLPGDPAGYVKVNLGQHSAFNEIRHLCHLLYGAEYNTSELRSHHHDDIHEYLISKTIMNADCVINLPKLKTHKKTGITVCLKNLVGINGNKNWLPHHREGTPCQGGDQYADDGIKHRIERKAMMCFRRLFPLFGPVRGIMAKPLQALGKVIFGDTNINTIRSGNWYGNDTAWRMVIDLNRILMYSDDNGYLQDNPARRIFCIVDGIVSGEGNGPLDPTPKPAGIVLAGANPLAVDLVAARLMDFHYRRLRLLSRGLQPNTLPLAKFTYDDVVCVSEDSEMQARLAETVGLNLRFQPHFGWQQYVEVQHDEQRRKRPCAG